MTGVTVNWRTVAEVISWIIGWTYFTLWALSFYPQLLQNATRKSTLGVATSYFPLNILGFLCYTLYTILLMWSPIVRHEYALRYPTAPRPTVRFNDFCFALHALILASITYSQFFPAIWGYEAGRKRERTRPAVWGVIIGIIVAIGIVTSIAAGNEHNPKAPSAGESSGFWDLNSLNYLDITTVLSFSKLLVTLIKYLPQVYTNYLNKSTEGFSIWQILLDFFGGLLSLVQLGIDAALEGGWEGVTGNLVKTGLGLISMALNIVFIIQHYFVYRGQGQRREDEGDGSETEVADEEYSSGERGVDERSPLVPESGNSGHGTGRNYTHGRDAEGDISE